ncbi:hypothetical protein [Ruegeria atlantica]|uniref:hypothetical protein n=1 Tax=Ruegeria atlantica TaxID=81569 RepID=UPI0024940F8D|nr:hypothetical protein [Ruegeria atlantica]
MLLLATEHIVFTRVDMVSIESKERDFRMTGLKELEARVAELEKRRADRSRLLEDMLEQLKALIETQPMTQLEASHQVNALVVVQAKLLIMLLEKDLIAPSGINTFIGELEHQARVLQANPETSTIGWIVADLTLNISGETDKSPDGLG